MREHLAGRTPRLTAYFCGIAVGLALLVAGLEAARLLVVGPLSGTAVAAFGTVGVAGGLLLAFVVGYLNGSILASWVAGAVPAAARLGGPLVDGSLDAIGRAAVGSLGVGVLIGTVGFVVAVEKHRRDAVDADLPAPPSRTDLAVLVGLSALVGGLLVAAPELV